MPKKSSTALLKFFAKKPLTVEGFQKMLLFPQNFPRRLIDQGNQSGRRFGMETDGSSGPAVARISPA
jgi:hypothetical protein